MSIKKIIGQVHLWLGFTSGLVVIILSITGCIYVFIDEIKALVYNHKLYVEAPNDARALPVSKLRDIAQTALSKEYPLYGAHIPSDPGHAYIFSCDKINPDAITYFGEVEYYKSVFINPYTGQVLDVENSKYEFFTLILWLHWSLWLSNDIGQPIVGTAVLIFVLSLITGIVLWWPKNRKAARQRFWFRWKAKTKWKRKNYDLHNIPGFYALLIALIIGLTGLIWAFPWFDQAVQFVANGGKQEPGFPVLHSNSTYPAKIQPLDKIFVEAKKQLPAASSYYIYFPEDLNEVVWITGRMSKTTHYNSTSLRFDSRTGDLLHKSTFEEQTNGEKLRSLNYDIHVGAILGMPGKILAFMTSLICAALPITGILIWWGRRNKRIKMQSLAEMS